MTNRKKPEYKPLVYKPYKKHPLQMMLYPAECWNHPYFFGPMAHQSLQSMDYYYSDSDKYTTLERIYPATAFPTNQCTH